MNIDRELLKYPKQTKAQALTIAVYATTSPDAFAELITCFLSNEVRLAQRAAWSVSWAAKKKPEMILPYFGDLVHVLNKPDVPDAVVRNSLRVLEDLIIPKEYHGLMLNTCFNFVLNRQTAIAIKAFSLQILFNLSQYYPEIKNELKIIIRDQIEYETAAFRSRGRKILTKIS